MPHVPAPGPACRPRMAVSFPTLESSGPACRTPCLGLRRSSQRSLDSRSEHPEFLVGRISSDLLILNNVVALLVNSSRRRV